MKKTKKNLLAEASNTKIRSNWAASKSQGQYPTAKSHCSVLTKIIKHFTLYCVETERSILKHI